jgi:hypothetical protein
LHIERRAGSAVPLNKKKTTADNGIEEPEDLSTTHTINRSESTCLLLQSL